MREEWRVSRREGLELTVTALVPAAVALSGELLGRGGYLAWLLPLLAVPVGLVLLKSWDRVGREGLDTALKRHFGRAAGTVLRGLYLAWGLYLLAWAGAVCTNRFLAATQMGSGTGPVLAAAFLLTGWLTRTPGRFRRTGRVVYLTTMVTLGAVGLLALPSLRGENLLPLTVRPTELAAGVLEVLALAGCGVYGLCIVRKPEAERNRGGWVIGPGLGLTALLLLLTGAFGPGLASRLEDPFLYILKGVGVPGAFQRGEAVLAAALALSDLILLGLLTVGCRKLMPKRLRSGVWVEAMGFIFALVLSGAEGGNTWGVGTLFGNLLLGVIVPLLIGWREPPYLVGKREN